MATTIAEGLMVPEIWSKLILKNFDDYGVMAECINRDYEGEIKYAGDTVRITQLGDITVNTHDDTTPIVYQDVDGTEQVLSIDQKKNWAFVIKDIEQKQANVKDLQTKYSNRARVAITNAKDTFLHTLGFAGVDADNQIGTVAITADNIYEICLDLYQALADSNAINSDGKAEDGKRPFLIVPPAVSKIMKASDYVTHATAKGDETVRKGALFEFAGFDIKQTTLVKNDGGFKILAGTKEAITYADQILKTRAMEDKDYFGIFVSGLYVYGAKVVQPKALASATFTIA